ncbi:MAG TPA: hypothetical protein DDW76_21935 [Cyanobacteria bacterium UBA11369]|nr:hypothetical protein [Cyanobacteria bacterium UBA11371]HBE32256.1 hypothetical protein [Cyanobacteria bacterium UBA11368]HBE51361.1 hypothetical protein [Cyanobacteria bacterium UBA11369]
MRSSNEPRFFFQGQKFVLTLMVDALRARWRDMPRASCAIATDNLFTQTSHSKHWLTDWASASFP